MTMYLARHVQAQCIRKTLKKKKKKIRTKRNKRWCNAMASSLFCKDRKAV